MGHDELDDEVCFGQLRGNIVGIQYYRGTVSMGQGFILQFWEGPLGPFKFEKLAPLNLNP